MTEIAVNCVFSGENITETELSKLLAELAESKGWIMGGGVREINSESIALQNKLFEFIRQTINNIISVDLSRITKNSHFHDDLTMDGLDWIELIMSVEKEFHIVLPDEHCQALKTPQKLIDYIIQNKLYKS